MKAMLLERAVAPLVPTDLPDPQPGTNDVLMRVRACGVCRTDLHVVDGELTRPKRPLVLGHEIVGEVIGLGSAVVRFALGDRVGVPWLGWTCGECRYCTSGRENLCDRARFTGYDIDGGYAELTVADERYCFALPAEPSDQTVASWLCAGLIRYRALKLAGAARRLGICSEQQYKSERPSTHVMLRRPAKRPLKSTINYQQLLAGYGHAIGRPVTAAARGRSFSTTELSRVRRPFAR